MADRKERPKQVKMVSDLCFLVSSHDRKGVFKSPVLNSSTYFLPNKLPEHNAERLFGVIDA